MRLFLSLIGVLALVRSPAVAAVQLGEAETRVLERALETLYEVNAPNGPGLQCKSGSDLAFMSSCDEYRIDGRVPRDAAGDPVGITSESAKALIRPLKGSPYAKYFNGTFLHSFNLRPSCFENFGFRFYKGDRCAAEHLRQNLKFFDSSTAVIMDSGHGHSVAMAAELISKSRYQGIWKIAGPLSPSHNDASESSEQVISALRYHAPLLNQAQSAAQAPPVFILDGHRSAPFDPAEFPPAGVLKKNGISKVVWITEGKTDSVPFEAGIADLTDLSKRLPDMDTVAYWGTARKLKEYLNQGLKIYHYRIDPYDCGF